MKAVACLAASFFSVAISWGGTCAVASAWGSGVSPLLGLAAADVETWSDGAPRTISGDTKISALHVAAATTVTVADGIELEVAELVCSAPLVKEGGGALVLRSCSADAHLTANAGTVRFVGGASADVNALAAGAWFHVDASASSSVKLDDAEHDGFSLVARWCDVRGVFGHPYANQSDSAVLYGNMPYLRPGHLNGRAVVDFGGQWMRSKTSGWGGCLEWSEQCDAVRTVFTVCADGDCKYQFFLGCRRPPEWSNTKYDFHRGLNGEMFHPTYAARALYNGGIFVDGVSTAPSAVYPDGFHVVRLAATAPVHASAFADDRVTVERGGQLIAETLVYTNEVDEATARRLEMRLQNKWVPDAASIASLALHGDARVEIADGVRVTVRAFEKDETSAIAGAGTLAFGGDADAFHYNLPVERIVKTGAGTTCVQATPARRVAVEAGRLEIVSGVANLTPAVHFDAARAAAAAFDFIQQNGTNFVCTWYDVRGKGDDLCKAKYQKVANDVPHFVADGQNGLPILHARNLYVKDQRGANSCGRLHFDRVVAARDAFVVFADSEDARSYLATSPDATIGFFLGAESSVPTSAQYNFHRGVGGKLLDTRYGCGAWAGTQVAFDGAAATPSVVVPEGFHLARISTAQDACVQALADDRTIRVGGLKYAEILLYSGAQASADEAAAVTAYLLNKWGLGDAKAAAPVFADVRVAKGASLSLPAWAQVAQLTVASADDLGARIDSKIQIPAGFALAFGDLDGVSREQPVTLAQTQGLTGVLPQIVPATAANGAVHSFRVYAEGADLMAVFLPRGTALLVR